MSSQNNQFSDMNSSAPGQGNVPQSPPPPYQGYDTFNADRSGQPAENATLGQQNKGQGDSVPQESPPPYTSRATSKSSVTAQPQQHTGMRPVPQNQYAPSQGGCCDFSDDFCTICMCCCCFAFLCNDM